MAFILFYEVIARYVVGKPTMWSQEVSLYIFIWAMLGSIGYTLSVQKHIAIDIITSHVPPSIQRALALFCAVAGFVFSVVISLQGYEMLEKTLRFNRVSPTPLEVPLWWVHSAVFVGFVLLALQYIVVFIDLCLHTNKEYKGAFDD